MAIDEPKGMEPVEPKGMSDEKSAILARLGAACNCVCSENQYSGARGAGKNSSTCGCYCALNNDNANSNRADTKRSTQVLGEIITYLQDHT
jgi:hypothetical protein